MKKIFKTYMMAAAVLALSACSQDDTLGLQNQGKEKPTAVITAGEVTDNSFSFKVSSAAPAAQYAYVVLEGAGNAAPDPKDIMFNEVSGALESDVFNVADKPEVEVTVKGSSAASYQVFAAAITSTGLLSEVISWDVTTTDTVIPSPKMYTRNGNSVTIEFTEPIKRGTGRVMVRCMQDITKKYYELTYISEDNIVISDGKAVITCPRPENGTANGAIFMLSYEDNAFVDANGNGCTAYWAKYDDTNNYYIGICWQDDKVNFSILSSYFAEYPQDYDWSVEGAAVTLTFPFNIHDSGVMEPMQVVYSELDGIKTMYVDSYSISEDQRTVSIVLPKVPQGYFDISIKEGTFYDDWGNESNAFSPDMDNLRYTVELPAPVCGNYSIGYGDGLSFPIRFEMLDDNHVVVYANWFNVLTAEGATANPILRGTLNKARKTITFDGTFYNEGNFTGGAFGRGFYNYDESYMLAFWGSGKTGEDPIVMTYGEDGYIATTSAFEYAFHHTSTLVESGSYGKVGNGTAVSFVSENE